MTIGTGYASNNDLAALLSADEDRRVAGAASRSIEAHPALMVTHGLDPSEGVNYSGGSSYSEELPIHPSSAGLVGVMGAGQPLCNGLRGIEEAIAKMDRYLAVQAGRPWPSRTNSRSATRGYLAPTDSNVRSNRNAAAQPGAAPGLNVGYNTGAYRDLNVGALSYEQAMDYAPSPLAEKVGELSTRQVVARRESRATPAQRKKVLSKKRAFEKEFKKLSAQAAKVVRAGDKKAAIKIRGKVRDLAQKIATFQERNGAK